MSTFLWIKFLLVIAQCIFPLHMLTAMTAPVARSFYKLIDTNVFDNVTPWVLKLGHGLYSKIFGAAGSLSKFCYVTPVVQLIGDNTINTDYFKLTIVLKTWKGFQNNYFR